MRTPQIPALAGMTPLGMAAATIDGAATEIAREDSAGRWFILMGNPGFNSAANNWNGYATKAGAVAASRRYAARGAKLREAR